MCAKISPSSDACHGYLFPSLIFQTAPGALAGKQGSNFQTLKKQYGVINQLNIINYVESKYTP